MEMQGNLAIGKRNFALETGGFGENTKFDDDGRLKRQGTYMFFIIYTMFLTDKNHIFIFHF